VEEHFEHEILIAGGGPVGCALALALGLGAAPRSVLLLDAASEPHIEDRRTLALAYGSRLILERLRVWNEILPRTDIRAIHVSQRGGFGSAVLTAAEAGTPALGYVVSYSSLQRALHPALSAFDHLSVRTGARVIRVDEGADAVQITYADQHGTHEVRARIAVVADGGALAEQTSRLEVRDYNQSAVVCNVSTARPHQNLAFERFTPEGPLALLPHGDDYAVVWTLSSQRSLALCCAEPDEFLEQLQTTFGMRAGKFLSIRDRATFPLALRRTLDTLIAGVIPIGNAAQSLHPVAGQGFNLGLRDAWELARLLSSVPRDADTRALAHRYQHERSRDRRISIALTDAMVRTFSNRDPALQWLRGCGLTLLDCMTPAKHQFMQQMMFGGAW
jgi:2-octaprenyl-6-methoxyphenol hydroxylase